MRIHNLGPVFVPVKDQDKSLDFYVNKLGFEKRADFSYGGGSRWIEVAPPGAANTIALVPTDEGRAMRRDAAYCAFVTDDIKAAHAVLIQIGVEVDKEIARRGSARTGLIALDVTIPDPAPSQFLFRDLDGNRFLIVQPD
jgi:catechol 2,3-dioxygenase-like lactoylglutathione lyase family enzyme